MKILKKFLSVVLLGVIVSNPTVASPAHAAKIDLVNYIWAKDPDASNPSFRA